MNINDENLDLLIKKAGELGRLKEPLAMNVEMALALLLELKMYRKTLKDERPLDFSKLYIVQEMTMDWARIIFSDTVLDWTDIALDDELMEISKRIRDNVYSTCPSVAAATAVRQS